MQRVKTWTVVALKEYVKKCGLPVTGSKKVLAASKHLVVHAVVNALFTKNTKSDSKHSIATVIKTLFIPFDLSADLTQIIHDLAYTGISS